MMRYGWKPSIKEGGDLKESQSERDIVKTQSRRIACCEGHQFDDVHTRFSAFIAFVFGHAVWTVEHYEIGLYTLVLALFQHPVERRFLGTAAAVGLIDYGESHLLHHGLHLLVMQIHGTAGLYRYLIRFRRNRKGIDVLEQILKNVSDTGPVVLELVRTAAAKSHKGAFFTPHHHTADRPSPHVPEFAEHRWHQAALVIGYLV